MKRRQQRGRIAAVLALGGMLVAPSAEAFPKPRYPTRVEGEAKPAKPDAEKPAPEAPKPAPREETQPETRAVPSSTVESSALEPAKADVADAKPPLTFDDTPPAAPKPLEAIPPKVEKAKTGPEKKKPQAPMEKLEAPKPKPPVTQATAYVVQRGDTLSGIARRFGVPSAKLMEANQLASAQSIKAGAKLKLPSGAKDSGKDPYATGPATLTAVPSAPRADTPKLPKAAATDAKTPAKPLPLPTTPSTQAGKPPVKVAPGGPVSSRTPPPLALPMSSPFPTDNQLRTLGEGRFVWPIRGEVLSPFGQLGPGLRNDGLNLSASAGSPVRASAGGEVVYAGDAVPGYGNLVLIKHADGWVTAYGHLGAISVRMRDRVTQGQQIGTVGQTGGVDRPQLHFEIRYAPTSRDKARPIDPDLVLPGS